MENPILKRGLYDIENKNQLVLVVHAEPEEQSNI